MNLGIEEKSRSKNGRFRMCVERYMDKGTVRTRTFHQQLLNGNWVAKSINYITEEKRKARMEMAEEVYDKHRTKWENADVLEN